MSFYTSLTGLNSASAQLGVTSNNIANVGTTGFKRSRADFGDIFATSPLQKSSSAIGQGVALKQVSQEFSQGNISFSSNALDLAISGDGFFPLKSADGLQDIYTRNGAFMLNDQFNVVNSAGQRLMAATVDSTGSANVNERVVLTIPQTTVGEARETSQVILGVNFPADAPVITEPFNRTNAASYNKSTALTVYDAGGNGYLATIYYVKTQNATQASPYNKWQTFVYIGDDEVKASLMQATNASKEKLYVNKYGEIQPYSAVKDFLTNNTKTQMFSLDQLTNKQVSQAASIVGVASAKDLAAGVNFQALGASNLNNLFKLQVDGSAVNVDLSYLAKSATPLTGTQIATELTNYLNKKFGDERYFEFPDAASSKIDLTVAGTKMSLDLSFGTISAKKTTDEVVVAIQARLQAEIDAATAASTTSPASGITVSYDSVAQTFKFKDSTATPRTIAVGAPATNAVLGLTTTGVTLGDDGLMPNKVTPNSESFLRPVADQRFGMQVTYNTGDKTFTFSSGTTGDQSTIAITPIDSAGAETNDAGINPLALSIFGLKKESVISSDLALRGTASTPAVAYGTAPTINLNNNFSVTAENNTFIVTVDDVRGTVTIPVGADYSLDRFKKELQNQINLLADTSGKNVNGVKVDFNTTTDRFSFTTSTATSTSFIKVSGKGPWGLEEPLSGLGATSSWIRPTQFTEAGKLVYIDELGKETTNGDGFTELAAWTPIYLDKGELTFDTGGNLESPLSGSQLDTVFLQDGKGALTINIDYSKSTQYTSPFAVLSQSQDGAPEGDLVGVTISVDGLVSASYSNGTQKSLAKILLVNFSNPTGLRQVGDSSFLASAASGNAILGTAGGAGFGTIRAGATERSNVDLTAELVDLITAQRNFQANAKAIETSTTMTQAIINIRG
ncbi:MAG: flagellar hook-basal body complex protein [Polaromonas sp.]